MTKLTINLPDNKVDFFKDLIHDIDDITIIEEENYDHIFTPELIKILEERSKTPKDKYIPAREIYFELKNKISV